MGFCLSLKDEIRTLVKKQKARPDPYLLFTDPYLEPYLFLDCFL